MLLSRGHVLVGLALVGAVLLAGARAIAPEPKTPAVRGLLSADPAEREQAQRELVEHRARVISELSDIVGAWGEDTVARMIDPVRGREPGIIQEDSVRRAIFVLGQMRASEAGAILTANLACPAATPDPRQMVVPHFVDGGPREVPIMVRHYRNIASRPIEDLNLPAVEAMLKIGDPCLDPLLEGLASNANTVKQGAWIRVLLDLRGHDGAAALLKDTLAEEKDPARRNCLEKCLVILEKVK